MVIVIVKKITKIDWDLFFELLRLEGHYVFIKKKNKSSTVDVTAMIVRKFNNNSSEKFGLFYKNEIYSFNKLCEKLLKVNAVRAYANMEICLYGGKREKITDILEKIKKIIS